MTNQKNKIITVVIATYNRQKQLADAIQSVINQSLDKSFYEIIIVDNNSKDNTRKIVDSFPKEHPTLKYVFEPKQGVNHARNTGISLSDSEYIGFLDDDSIAEKKWLETACKIIREINPEIFGGQYIPYYDAPKPKWFKDKYEIRKISDKAGYLEKRKFLACSNMFFKKEVFNTIGIFDKDLGMRGDKIILGEETQLQVIADQKGIRRYYDPDLIIYNLVPASKMKLAYLIRRSFSGGATEHLVFQDRKYTFIGDLKRMMISFLVVSKHIIKYPWREKKELPYWQNYFLEKVIRHFGSLGRLASHFKSEKYERK